MDIYTLALSIAYSNKIGKQIKDQAFKTQIELNRDILNNTGKENTFYFLPKEVGKPQNGYDEYIYFNNKWELMGGTDIDLSGYMTLAPINPSSTSSLPVGQLYYSDSDSECKLGVKISNNNYALIPDYLYVRDNFRVISRTYRVEQVLKVDGSFDMGSYYETRIFPSQNKPEMETGDFIRNDNGDLWIVAWKSTNFAPEYSIEYGIKLLARAGIDINNININDKENISNKVGFLSSSSTDDEYPSAKCVYNMIGDVETLLSQV